MQKELMRLLPRFRGRTTTNLVLYRESFLSSFLEAIPVLWGIAARPKRLGRIGKTWEGISMADGAVKGLSVQHECRESDMTQAQIRFKEMIQDSQTYASFDADEDHVVSRIFFDLEVAGRQYNNMMVEVRQPYGTRYETEPLEVAKPTGPYDGPSWNHNAFSEHCKRYYNTLVSQKGRGIRIGAGASSCRMRDNRFSMEMLATIDLPEAGSGAW